MALTAEQETEILTRLEAGESPGQIIHGMGIVRSDFMAFRAANRFNVANARKGKNARLARLNRRKTDLQNQLATIEDLVTGVEAEISATEAEEA